MCVENLKNYIEIGGENFQNSYFGHKKYRSILENCRSTLIEYISILLKCKKSRRNIAGNHRERLLVDSYNLNCWIMYFC